MKVSAYLTIKVDLDLNCSEKEVDSLLVELVSECEYSVKYEHSDVKILNTELLGYETEK